MPAKYFSAYSNRIARGSSRITKTSGIESTIGRILTRNAVKTPKCKMLKEFEMPKRREETVKNTEEKNNQTALSDLPYDAIENILSFLNKPEDYSSINSLRSTNQCLKGAVDFFVKHKKNIPEFHSVKLTKMRETIRSSFEVEITVKKDAIPLLHNFQFLKDRVIDKSTDGEFASFTIPVRNRRDPVIDYLSEAFSLQIKQLVIENIRSLEEWKFIRTIIGDAKITDFVAKVDLAMRKDSDEFLSDLFSFLENSSVKSLDLETNRINPTNPHVFIDGLIGISARRGLKCILQDPSVDESNTLFGLTDEEWEEKKEILNGNHDDNMEE